MTTARGAALRPDMRAPGVLPDARRARSWSSRPARSLASRARATSSNSGPARQPRCAAYDDSAGITAELNRNILHVLNRELDADFDPASFDHVAIFDERHEWIEMRLRSRTRQVATIRALDLDVHFDEGKEIRTEVSAKFTRPRLEADLAVAGLDIAQWFTDPNGQFTLSLSRRHADDGRPSLSVIGRLI